MNIFNWSSYSENKTEGSTEDGCLLLCHADFYWRFRGSCCSHFQRDLMMEAACTSQALVNSYQITWHSSPEDSHLQVIFSFILSSLFLYYFYMFFLHCYFFLLSVLLEINISKFLKHAIRKHKVLIGNLMESSCFDNKVWMSVDIVKR